jgi:hypothetical protein
MRTRSVAARLSLVLPVAWLVAACATTAPSEKEVGAKAFATMPSAANIYVYAWSTGALFVPTETAYSIAVNDVVIGTVYSGSLVLATVAPGPHVLSTPFVSYGGELKVTPESRLAGLTLTTAAGRNYYVRVQPDTFKINLEVEKDTELAQERIGRSRLVGSATLDGR